MKNYFRYMTTAALFVLAIVMFAVVTPWCINEGGTTGLIAIPFLWITVVAIITFVLKRCFNPEKSKND